MRNHFDGRSHRYKAICFCPKCDQETRRRVSKFWELPPETQKEVAVISDNSESVADVLQGPLLMTDEQVERLRGNRN